MGGQGEFSGHDVLHLSEDGTLLVHVAVDEQFCGDTICTESELATVIDLAHGNRKWTLPGIAEWSIDLIESSPYVALMGRDAVSLIKSGNSLESEVHKGYDALAVLPKYGQALVRSQDSTGLALIDFGAKGKVTAISSTSMLGGSPMASRDGRAIAYVRPPTICVSSKQDPDSCHTQIWELDVWTREKGVLHTFYSTEPLEALWVGSDGSVLVSGDLLAQVPAHAEPDFSGEHGLHLIGADGKERKNLAFSVTRLIEREQDLLVIAQEGTHATLGLLDIDTGEIRKLDEADTLLPQDDPDYPRFDLYLDREQKRLVYVKNWYEPGWVSRNSLHAVALP